MKLNYSSPVILGFVSQSSEGASAGRFQSSNTCCNCTGHGKSRA